MYKEAGARPTGDGGLPSTRSERMVGLRHLVSEPPEAYVEAMRLRTTLLATLLLLGACDPSAPENATVPAVPDSLVQASTPSRAAYGEVIYVPAYSHIWHISAGRDFQLTVTLSIRNPNPWSPVTVNRVDYFDSQGDLAHVYLAQPRELDPLETLEFVIEETDERGGSGANFLVGWEGGVPMAPLVEAVMIGTGSGQGLSFTSVGRPVPTDEIAGGEALPR